MAIDGRRLRREQNRAAVVETLIGLYEEGRYDATAAEVAERAGAIATQTHQQVVGVVENMSWLDLPDGSRMEVFGSGGGEAVSDALTRTLGARVPLLGQIPLDTRLREAGDAGAPIVLAGAETPAAKALDAIANKLTSRQRGLSGMSLGLTPVRR